MEAKAWGGGTKKEAGLISSSLEIQKSKAPSSSEIQSTRKAQNKAMGWKSVWEALSWPSASLLLPNTVQGAPFPTPELWGSLWRGTAGRILILGHQALLKIGHRTENEGLPTWQWGNNTEKIRFHN